MEHVSDTALLVASARARETERGDGLIHDPYAASLAGERGRELLGSVFRLEWMAFGIGLRTRFIDEFLQREIEERSIGCVLCLGAGLDARPWRLALPEQLVWIEVDFPPILDYKYARMKDVRPRCLIERLTADLTESEEREHALHFAAEKGNRVLILTEGLLMYLPGATVRDLAAEANALPAFHTWILDIFSAQLMRTAHGAGAEKIEKLRHETHLEGGEILAALKTVGWQDAARRTFMKDGMPFALARAKSAGIARDPDAPRPSEDDPAGVWMFQRAV